MRQSYKSLLFIGFLSLSVFVSGVTAYFVVNKTASLERQVVTVDILKIMEDYSIAIAQQSKDAEKLKQSAQRFSQQLEKILAINAQQNHLTIMPKQAVIQGAQDITPQIEALLFQSSEKK